MKALRNQLIEKELTRIPRLLKWVDEDGTEFHDSPLDFGILQQLVDIQENPLRKGLVQGFHLKPAHVRPNIWQVQSVKLVTQVFGLRTAAFVETNGHLVAPKNVEALVDYCRFWDRTFNRLNSRVGDKNPERKPVSVENREAVMNDLWAAEKRLLDLKTAFPNEKQKKGLSKDVPVRLANETIDNWLTTIRSAVQFIDQLLDDYNFDYVQMHRGSCHGNVTCYEVAHAFKVCCMSSMMKIGKNANIEEQDVIQVEQNFTRTGTLASLKKFAKAQNPKPKACLDIAPDSTAMQDTIEAIISQIEQNYPRLLALDSMDKSALFHLGGYLARREKIQAEMCLECAHEFLTTKDHAAETMLLAMEYTESLDKGGLLYISNGFFGYLDELEKIFRSTDETDFIYRPVEILLRCMEASPLCVVFLMHRSDASCSCEWREKLSSWTEEDLVKEETEYGVFNGFCVQERLLRTTILSPQRQPDVSYRKKFLKMLMERVEEKGWEVLEEVWCAYSQLCRSETDGTDEPGYRTFFLSETTTVSLIHQPLLISDGTTGLSTWDAAFYMVEWLNQHPDIIKEKRVLELGCGSGLTGICLSKLFVPAQYVFSDCHSGVLGQLTKNLRINELADKKTLKVCELDWLTVTDEDFPQSLPDIILACDIAYDPDVIQAFFRVLSIFSRRCGSQLDIFIALKTRSSRTAAFFHESAENQGWKVDLRKMGDGHRRIFPSGVYDGQDCNIFQLVRPTL